MTKKFDRDFQLPKSLNVLGDIATNMWYSWNGDAIELFKSINPEKWVETHHNPVATLLDTPAARLEQLAKDKAFMKNAEAVIARWTAYKVDTELWFNQTYPDFAHKIAYFSAEFGFHESLPIYSGGLGVLAGDHCKSASDLGVPLVSIGLLYKRGYFRQMIDAHGQQVEADNNYDFVRQPVQPALNEKGQEVYIEVPVGDANVKVKVWVARIGRNPLYLLDTNLEENRPEDRELTAQLYGGGQEMRIRQEVILGVGGIRALRVLEKDVRAFHVNEGHAAFISLERMREYMADGLRFTVALELIRSSTIFTTHTPVPAGHDTFPMGMFEWTLRPILNQLGFERKRTIDLGYDHKKDAFNMTYLAINTSTFRNGVSKLHGDVSRQMFHELYPNIHVDEVPVDHVTNGVHASTWMAEEIKELVAKSVGDNWVKEQVDLAKFKSFRKLPNKDLWATHIALKTKLFDFARPHLKAQYERNGASAAEIKAIDGFLNPDVLTIGFARRFATYKRATLLFSDLDRLDKLINDPKRPVQFVFAGKAHPADKPGQAFIQEIYRVSQLEKFKGKVVFLENYDMNIARHLVQGVDVWLNNPKRPLEASGTSGQKAAMNGVLNFSVLDGWWEEGFDGSNGWAINSDYNASDDVQFEQNAESLYVTLESSIVPMYYSSVGAGVPDAWVEHMKNSIETLTPVYNTDRMVQDYTNKFYVNTAVRFMSYRDSRYKKAVEIEMFKANVQDHWNIVHVDSVVDRPGSSIPGKKRIEVNVQIGPFALENVIVEAVYHGEVDGRWFAIVEKLNHVAVKDGHLNTYEGYIPAHLVHGPHYYVRVRPDHSSFGHAFEMPQIART